MAQLVVRDLEDEVKYARESGRRGLDAALKPRCATFCAAAKDRLTSLKFLLLLQIQRRRHVRHLDLDVDLAGVDAGSLLDPICDR